MKQSSTLTIFAGIGRVLLRNRVVGIGNFQIISAPDTETWFGILSDPEVIDLIVAAGHAALCVSKDRAIAINVDGRGEADNQAMFNCSNPLLGADDVGTAA